MSLGRRDFLKLLLVSASTRLYAAPAASNTRFLLVFLRGGYDATNLLVPISSGFYYEARPNIAVAKDSALPLDADWALHPALGGSVYLMFQKNQAVFVPFAGTEDVSRSHFETQDSIELGQPPERSRNFQSGFLNRLVAELGGAKAISFTDQLPIAMRGEAKVANMGMKTLLRPGVGPRQSDLIAQMYKGTALDAQVAEGFEVRQDVMSEMAAEMVAANRNAITSRGFASEARRVGKLMKEKFNVGFIDVGGWDTHVGQGGTSGYLAARLEELGRGLAALGEELGPAWNDTVVVVMSEFGRTFRENGNRGTDHGHGTVYWFLGGAIRGANGGSAVRGEQVRVHQAALFQNRDYPVLNEYRALLGGVFARLYGLDAARLERIFSGVRPRDLGLI